MYKYQRGEYFAQVAGGMEEYGLSEAKGLGAKNIVQKIRGISFKADQKTLYRINYTSRFLTRVLAPLISFKCPDRDTLYKNIKRIEWDSFFYLNKTFAVFSNVSASSINNSQFASLCAKDAIADYFMDKFGRRPNVDTKDPDAWISVHIKDDYCVVSFDTSGGSLHKRGYRKQSVTAPIQETLAAIILEITEWDGTKCLYDPMCGSGTLLSEAYMKHCNIPSGYLKKSFGFEHLPDFEKELWESVKAYEDNKIIKLPEGLIRGSDADTNAVEATLENMETLPGGEDVEIKQAAFMDLKNIENAVIVCNPPYGIRLSKGKNLDAFYKAFGDFLKQKCKGGTAYIYFGEREYIKKLGLKASFKKPLKNGGLDGRLVKIELY
ncbi:MAG: class I SAM-dependent RNA methyltransferase [Deltaproteobacteria bacterium]|nr:class I SAM-dependent RNA methyltransferase [Deltaproteobacteria bacterium]